MPLQDKEETKKAEELKAFLASLDSKDRIIHDLAVAMLKTRYTPEKSNAWIAFQKAKADTKKASA
jgi:hypothetical protein